MHSRTRRALSIAACLAASLAVAATADADVITQWNEQVFASGGPQIQRTLAMVHIAMFDAANGIDAAYTPYLRNLPAPATNASAEAAAAAAAYGVLVRVFPGQQAALAAVLAASLATVPDGPSENAGVAYGDLVAQAVFNARLNDNILAADPAFVAGIHVGDYQLTSPGPPQPVNIGAAAWLPFALQSASQFRPNGPPALGSVTYARDLEETKRIGGSVSAERTAEDEEIARWHTEQAQFQFNRIARNETASDGRGLLAHARLFAILNIALADATTSVFEAKYVYRSWRPVTAIRNADLDGNSRTSVDFGWAPFLPTPPHPEYPAAHGAVQGAGARVLKSYFGPNHSFETTSPTVAGIRRRYASIDAFADEGSMARIYGGMHFRSSLEEGAREGMKVGNWVIDNYLLPLR